MNGGLNCPECKAAIDCTGTDQRITFNVIRFSDPDVIEHTGYLYELSMTRHLIIAGKISDSAAILAFIALNLAREMRYRDWTAAGAKKAEFIEMNKVNSAEYHAWQVEHVEF